MKERIVIDNEKVIAFRPKGLDVYAQEYVEEIDIIENTKKVEQVPETFEELKELCEELKNKLNKEIWEMKIKKAVIHFGRKWETKEIGFTSCGNMVSNLGWDLLMTNLTPAQMWNIIKNLIGE